MKYQPTNQPTNYEGWYDIKQKKSNQTCIYMFDWKTAAQQRSHTRTHTYIYKPEW